MGMPIHSDQGEEKLRMQFKAIREIVDMPDRKMDLFIQACLQNNGRISARIRASHFEFLSDEEVTRMERAIRSAYER